MGLAVTDTGFDPSTLTYWRRRLAASTRPERIFEVVAEVVTETGAVAGKTRRALDSTILDDAVARQDTVTQLIAAIRRVARDVPGADEIVAARTSGHDYSRPGKPEIAWDDPAAREELVSVLVNDALAVLAGLEELHRAARALRRGGRRRWRCWRWSPGRTSNPPRAPTAPTDAGASPAGRPGPGHLHRRPRRPPRPQDPRTPPGRLQGPRRRRTRHRADHRHRADQGHRPGQQRRRGRDRPARGRPHHRRGQPLEVLGDSAYGTGDALEALAKAGHTPVIKPWPLRPAVEGGFNLDDFTSPPPATP